MKRPRRKSDRKTTRQEKARSTRGDEPAKGIDARETEAEEAGNPKTEKGREARELTRGTRGRHSWKEAEAEKRRIRKRHLVKKSTERMEATVN